MLRFALRFPICLPGVASVHSRIAGDTLGRGVPRLFVRTDAQDTMTMVLALSVCFPIDFPSLEYILLIWGDSSRVQ